ncbi:MAG: hypothetical protein K0R25_65 [Rickettsiaceae bacterium]|jgi:uncharacterized RDD family membrane protein YckC|nr:hypothetical protein [Rickettsiaceae bacterium]
MLYSERVKSLLEEVEQSKQKNRHNLNSFIKPDESNKKGEIKEKKYAGFWRRCIAQLVDNALLILSAVLPLLAAKSFGFDMKHLNKTEELVVTSIATIFLLLYHLCFLSSTQTTPGRRAMDIIIETKDGEKPSIYRIIAKILFSYVLLMLVALIFESSESIFSSILELIVIAIIILPIIFTKEKTALYDLISGTRAVIADLNSSTLDVEFASFWRRLFAFIIDLAIFIPVFLLFVLLPLPNICSILAIVFFVIYWIYFPSAEARATVGQRMLGIYIVTKEGDKISFFRSLVKFFFSFSIFCIGFLMIPFTKEKTSLSDLVCNTRVLKR